MRKDAYLLLINHSAELGGAELSLYDFARSTAGVRVLTFEHGPFTDLLKRASIPTEILVAGSVLELRRDDGLIKVAFALPRLGLVALQLARRMRRADVIYANSQKALIVSALANAIARKPLIWHLHDILTAEHFSSTMRSAAIALSNRFVSHVIANSAATAEAFRAAGGRQAVTVVHNGIDSSLYDQLSRDSARIAVRAEIITGDAPILALFGRLSSWKGQDIAIQALRHLPECHLLLVGAAMFGDAQYEHYLRALAKDTGVADRVHFLGFRKDIAPLMVASDIIVHCSTAPEPFGRVIVEAMMAGTPVIAAAAGGALEIITDGVSGLLIPPGDPMSLSKAVRILLEQPQRAAALGSSGRATALKRFSLSNAVLLTKSVIDVVRLSHKSA